MDTGELLGLCGLWSSLPAVQEHMAMQVFPKLGANMQGALPVSVPAAGPPDLVSSCGGIATYAGNGAADSITCKPKAEAIGVDGKCCAVPDAVTYAQVVQAKFDPGEGDAGPGKALSCQGAAEAFPCSAAVVAVSRGEDYVFLETFRQEYGEQHAQAEVFLKCLPMGAKRQWQMLQYTQQSLFQRRP